MLAAQSVATGAGAATYRFELLNPIGMQPANTRSNPQQISLFMVSPRSAVGDPPMRLPVGYTDSLVASVRSPVSPFQIAKVAR